ncbi:putative reverse transcriptase domain-containing protein [Tanacetum coccineum]
MQNREHGRMILESVEHGPLIWPTIEENSVTRTEKYDELSATEKIQADCDLKATNIILQGLPTDVYSLVNHHRLINDMNIYNMKLEQFQVNTKFLNSLPPEWSKFVTDVKLVRDLRTTNFDQLHAYLEQHELHANEVCQQRIVKCFNCQREGHMARQCPKPKRKRDTAWFKDKVLLTVITHSAAYQADDLDTYDSDCDDFSIAKAVLMANLSSYGSYVLSEYLLETQNAAVHDINSSVQNDAMILFVFEQLSNQVTNCNKVNKDNLIANESLSAELERYKERVKLLEERQNVDLSTREKLIMDDIIREKNAQFADFEKEINYLKQTLSEQSKEKELLTKTFNVFKNESKEKEAKNIDKEIALEKKVKELDNIVCKMGQSAQTVHMLTKPQVFYDNNLKQALGFQNPFYLKKAQQIRLMLYDGSVIAKETNVISIADSEETLMLEEESRSKMLLKQRVIRSTKSRRSKSTDNTKNDRIMQISSSTHKKNKVEDHNRIVNSSLNKSNCVVKPSGNANVQHSKLNTNSELMCVKCNSSMFDARHELCFLEFVFDMNANSKSKSVKKAKKKEEWKPTGKVFTKIRYNWRPTGKTFTLVGNARPKVPKTNGSNSKPKIAKSVISNKTEPSTYRGSNTSIAPSSSSSVDLRLSKLFCGIWTPDAPST